MWSRIVDFFVQGAPGWNQKTYAKKKPLMLKKSMEINPKDLNKKTKTELEKLGRKLGIELDRRLTKAKLVSQIKKQLKK
jgi:hypothetical protein